MSIEVLPEGAIDLSRATFVRNDSLFAALMAGLEADDEHKMPVEHKHGYPYPFTIGNVTVPVEKPDGQVGRRHLLIVGPPASGKTLALREFITRTRLPWSTFGHDADPCSLPPPDVDRPTLVVWDDTTNPHVASWVGTAANGMWICSGGQLHRIEPQTHIIMSNHDPFATYIGATKRDVLRARRVVIAIWYADKAWHTGTYDEMTRALRPSPVAALETDIAAMSLDK
jgi:hypothetical protein